MQLDLPAGLGAVLKHLQAKPESPHRPCRKTAGCRPAQTYSKALAQVPTDVHAGTP